MGKSKVQTSTEKFFWRGKRVSKKVYECRLRMADAAKKLNKSRGQKKQIKSNVCGNNISSAENLLQQSASVNIYGRRVIHVETLAHNLICQQCQSVLSLLNAQKELKHGFASIFTIQCHQCLILNKVPTDKRHSTPNGQTHFDVNTRLAMGALHSGMGRTQINKLLTTADVPRMNWKTYKSHKVEVGQIAEFFEKES